MRCAWDNKQFLVFLMAVISAVDEYADLLRLSVATAGNDHRLGANEAPPAVISVFIGDELAGVLKSIEDGETYLGEGAKKVSWAHVLPHITMDTTDRNRTSPFAFTGNKFEFRMPGSALSMAQPNLALNAAVAQELEKIYEELSKAPEGELDEAIDGLLRKLLSEHKRIIFNGNGYTDAWIEEAEKRGLANLKSVPDAIPYLVSDKVVDLMTRHKILTKEELESRCEIFLENYSKKLHIEALTMAEMTRKDVTSSIIAYADAVAAEASHKSAVSLTACRYEKYILTQLDEKESSIYEKLTKLEEDTRTAESLTDVLETARYYHDTILSDMEDLRKDVDEAEKLIPEKYLSYPTYGQMLFSLR